MESDKHALVGGTAWVFAVVVGALCAYVGRRWFGIVGLACAPVGFALGYVLGAYVGAGLVDEGR